MPLNDRSRKNLVGVHPDLVRVVERAAELSPVPFVVTEGLRNLERQKKLKAAGKSWTLNSRHLNGMAVDVVDADDFKYDLPDMEGIAKAFKAASAELKIPIVWGGDWKTRDSPHFELSRTAYPEDALPTSTKVAEAAKTAATSKPAVVVGTSVATGLAVDAVSVPSSSIPAPPDLTAISAWKTFGQTIADIGGWAAGHPVDAVSVPSSSIPAPPDLTAISAWKTFGQTIADIGGWAAGHPVIAASIGAWVLSIVFWDRLKALLAQWRAA